LSIAQASVDRPRGLPPREDWCPLVEMAIAEDVGSGDLTSSLIIEPERQGQARIEARSAMQVCGLPIVEEVFRQIDPEIRIEAEPGIRDGVAVAGPAPLLRLRGRYRSILAGERTALNFLGRLCGVATQTQALVCAISDLSTQLVDTRKTTPGWRALEKYAVSIGGGQNHRIGLFDAVLVKDNHIAAAGGLDAAIERVLGRTPAGVPIQIEVESEQMADRAVELGCSFLLLDNLPPDTIRRIVERHAPDTLLEASGGIGPENLRSYAETGIARISMGALTHSVACADVALEIDLLPLDTKARS
jgi:nicotinate-nucleotide pyrophosphorylase (carboxylating)